MIIICYAHNSIADIFTLAERKKAIALATHLHHAHQCSACLYFKHIKFLAAAQHNDDARN